MAEYSQDSQDLKIFTDLPEDDLLLTRFEGEEAISRPFRFNLELVSVRTDVDGRELLRTPAAITFPLHDGSTRTIHGLFRRFAQTGMSEDLAQYRAEIVAWPWFLTLRRRRRVFQEMSILEIAEEIFGDWGYSDFDFKCANRAPREYIVQYDETDWDFVSRWLEAEGIFYFFEHSEQGHTLVLADGNSQSPDCPEISEALFRSESVIETDVVTSIVREHQVQVGAVALRDYDYLQPSFSLETSLNGAAGADENYDYPGDFTELDDGDRYARYRLEAQEARQEEVEGTGNCRWMVSGHSFELDGHFNPGVNGKYLITAVRHQCASGAYRSGQGESFDYQNSFFCIPAAVPFRPLRTTRWPTVRGTQTAVVVGPSGEDVWTDDHGRVKLQFHWDREGEEDENSSCWVRVSSPWAGKRWGYQQVPRLGHEVVVDFVEGDPDRPLITGRVHNADNMPPLDTPDNASKSIMRDHAGNEIVFEGKEGAEQIRIYSPYNNTEILMGAPSSPPGCRITSDGELLMKFVGDAVEEYLSNHTELTAGNKETTTTGNEIIKWGGMLDTEKGGPETSFNVNVKSSTTVGVEHSTFVGGKISTSHAYVNEITGGWKHSKTSAKNLDESIIKQIKANAQMTLEAGAGMDLEVGGSSISISPDKIVLKSAKIIIEGTGSVTTKSGGDIKELPGGKVSIPKGKMDGKNIKES
ncbi:MAG: type VI secretion system tip protein TssI/VgrG [Gemmatimonadota bacterium]